MAKSPFAQAKVVTYTYPEPMDPKKESDIEMIDPEEVGEHWVKIRIPRSSEDVDHIADYTQSMVVMGSNGDGAKFEQRIAHANRSAFELLVQEWSFDAECVGSNYAKLDVWSGDWIRRCISDAVRQGTTRDYAKKTPESSTQLETSLSSQSSQVLPEPASE